MSLKSVCPMIATDRLQQTRAFYDWLGFKVVCADPRTLQFAWPGDPDLRIGFMTPDDGSQLDVLQTRFEGAGLVLRFEVVDIDTLYRRIGAVYTLAVKLREGHCGRRHFAIVDPNGVVLDFVGLPQTAADRRERRNGATTALAVAAKSAVPYPRPSLAGYPG